MKKLKKIVAMYLAVIMCCLPMGNTVFAADISDGNQGQVSANNGDLQIEGTDSVGNVLASAISSEQSMADARSQSANSISGLKIAGNIASVELHAETEADLVVAIYDEQQIQMLASGKTAVSSDENNVEITISGKIPDYFIASAYLLDSKTHKALCNAYTTELYTQEIKNLQESTVKDFDEEKVVQLDGNNEKTNFAVYNTGTVVVDETTGGTQLLDNGNGKYTVENAGSNIRNLKKGDTLSYEYKDGTLLLIKVAEISVNGTTAKIVEDSNAELKDYFDYVKIETDSSTGECNVDNSELEDGITPVDNTKRISEFSAKAGGNVKVNRSYTYKVSKKIKNISVKGSLKFEYGISLEYYMSVRRKHFALQFDYSTGINIDISGELLEREFPLGRIALNPVPCVSIGFRPYFVLKSSGKLAWSGTLKGKAGGAYDNSSGFSNTSSLPTSKSEFKLEGTFFLGIKATPYVVIISEDLGKASLEVTAGGEFSAKQQIYDSSKDVVHECKRCLDGNIKAKASAVMSVDFIKDKFEKKTTLFSAELKIADFYWSVDHREFGWTTCPYICYPVNVTVKDKDENSIIGKSTLTVTDRNSGNPVEIRTKEQSLNSIEATDSKKTKFYLPNGDYTVNADTDIRAGKQEFFIEEQGTNVTVKLNMNKDQNIVWYIENNDTLHIGGTGDMPDYVYTSGKHKIPTNVPWAKEAEDKEIKKVIIEEGITSIGDFGLAYLESLKEVVIPEEVVSIGKCAFAGCSNLSEINLPENMVEIGSSAFSHCTKLEKIEIPKNVTVIKSGTFVDCINLKNVDLPDEVTEIGESAFEWCEGLGTIQIPQNVKIIGSFAFANIKSVDICFNGNKPEFGKNIFADANNITVVYPGTDSTWNGIESENFGGTDIIWIAFDLGIILATPEENANETVGEVDTEIEEEPQEEDFTSDIPSADDSSNADSDDNTSIEDDTSSAEVEINEESQGDFDDSSEEEVQVFETPVSYAQDDTVTTGESMMFSGLVPYGRYVFLMVKDDKATDILENDNLLYIKQGNADSEGMISFRYMLKENFANPIKKIYGDQPKDIKNLKVTLSETTYTYSGSAKKPSVKVTDGSYILVNGTDYTVSYSQNTNAGVATVQIIGKGLYAGKKNVNFNIRRAYPELAFKNTKVTKKYGSSSFTNSLKTRKTDGKIYYSSSNTKVASVDKNTGKVRLRGAGTTVITASAKTGNNYRAGKATFTLKVTKNSMPFSVKITGKFGKEKSTIYRLTADGKKKKQITISGRVDKLYYVYDNKLFYRRSYGTFVPSSYNAEYLNLKNNKRTKLTDNLDIVGHRGRYAMVLNADYKMTNSVYILDIKTKKRKWIDNNVLCNSADIGTDGKIYYLKCIKSNYKTGNNKYAVYSCRKDGSGKKKLRTLYSKADMALKITNKYVVMGCYGEKGKTYRY